MSILDFIFGDEVIEESEGVTHMEILDFVGNSFEMLEKRIKKLEEQQSEILNSSWQEDEDYIGSYCPNCKNKNVSQVPKKAKKSMKFKCGNCGVEYRIYFDKKEIEEGDNG